MPVITGPNCSLFLLLSFSFAIVISLYLPDLSRPLRCHPLVSPLRPLRPSPSFDVLGAPPSPFPSALSFSPLPPHAADARRSFLPSRFIDKPRPGCVLPIFKYSLSRRLSTDNSSEIDRSDGEFPGRILLLSSLSLSPVPSRCSISARFYRIHITYCSRSRARHKFSTTSRTEIGYRQNNPDFIRLLLR